MEIRRLRKPSENANTLSWKTSLNIGDLRRVLLRFGSDLKKINLPVANESDIKAVFRGAFFGNMKPYQSEDLISWCMLAAMRTGLIRETAPDSHRFIVISE